MPFIFRKSPQLNQASGNWEPIPIDEIRHYRKLFVDRHHRLLGVPAPLNFQEDFLSLNIDFRFFNTLVQQASIGHYLVAHFICDPIDNNFKNLDLALCIKEKGGNGPSKDKIIGKIYSSQGRVIDEETFCKARACYNERLKLISESSGEYVNDRKGRAHQITEDMKNAVNKMGLVTDKVYIYFIVDNYLAGSESISVVYSDSEINFETIEALVWQKIIKADLEKIFDAYDHGTACCPIG